MSRRRMMALWLGSVIVGLASCGRKGDLELPPPQPDTPPAAVEDERS